MRVLVTGGSGFIGTNRMRSFIERGVHVLTIAREGELAALEERLDPLMKVPRDLDIFSPFTVRNPWANTRSGVR